MYLILSYLRSLGMKLPQFGPVYSVVYKEALSRHDKIYQSHVFTFSWHSLRYLQKSDSPRKRCISIFRIQSLIHVHVLHLFTGSESMETTKDFIPLSQVNQWTSRWNAIHVNSSDTTCCMWPMHLKRQWRGALMFSLISAWINGWVNNRDAGNLRRYRAHYDVTVM